jgi:hypothetical protein
MTDNLYGLVTCEKCLNLFDPDNEICCDANTDECVVKLQSGATLRTSPYPIKADYIRVCAPDGREVGYWVKDEFLEDFEGVFGAVMGLAKSLELLNEDNTEHSI